MFGISYMQYTVKQCKYTLWSHTCMTVAGEHISINSSRLYKCAVLHDLILKTEFTTADHTLNAEKFLLQRLHLYPGFCLNHTEILNKPPTCGIPLHQTPYPMTYICVLLLCNNILRTDTTLRATETDPLLLFTFCTLLGNRWLDLNLMSLKQMLRS
jgi:hypothetical protein